MSSSVVGKGGGILAAPDGADKSGFQGAGLLLQGGWQHLTWAASPARMRGFALRANGPS